MIEETCLIIIKGLPWIIAFFLFLLLLPWVAYALQQIGQPVGDYWNWCDQIQSDWDAKQ